jgi:hypothetical protein
MPDTPDDRLTLVERAQETFARTQQTFQQMQVLHTDVLGQHALWHQQHREAHDDHRERMAKLEENHHVLLDLVALQEERLQRLDALMQAIKDLLERGHNGH